MVARSARDLAVYASHLNVSSALAAGNKLQAPSAAELPMIERLPTDNLDCLMASTRDSTLKTTTRMERMAMEIYSNCVKNCETD